MKKIIIIILGIVLIFVFAQVFAKNNASTDFEGRWSYSTESSAFTLFLNQNGNTLNGTHISTMLNGDKIDANVNSSQLSISGTLIDPSTADVDFKSYYSFLSGKATIKKLSDTQIEWVITQKPQGEYFIPDSVILTKQ